MPPPDLLIDCLRDPTRLSRLSPGEWDRLVPQAREAQMLATLWHLLRQQCAEDAVSPDIQRHLKGAWQVAERRVIAMQWELRCLRGELPGFENGRPLLLKGVAYIVCGLPHARSRVCADIDVLVPRDQIERVEHMLGWAGWTTGELDPYDERYYREWMHQSPPLQHRRRGSTLDLHHNILPGTARRSPDPRTLLERARPLPDDPVFATPDPVHMVIHSAVHLFADSEWDKAARDFYDLDRMIRHFGELEGRAFWDSLAIEADKLVQARELFYALRYCSCWFETPVPPDVMKRIQRDAPWLPVRLFMDWVFRHATTALASGPNPRLTRASRRFLYIRSHWIKMPPVMLVRHLLHKAFLSPREETP